MKILVFSDSHGKVDPMEQVMELEKPDRVFHLGDCERDAKRLKKRYPDMVLDQVPGNCDMSDNPHTKILLIGTKKIMMTHGHDFNVKASFLSLAMAAKEREVDVVLFGHTHRIFYENHNGLWMLNPGSIGEPRGGNPASYGIIEVDDAGELHIEARVLS